MLFGMYDDGYISHIQQQVEWAKQQGLYVFLDMHQDLYSVLFEDGAPEWATLTNGTPHVDLGGVWSDAYFTSPAVQTALDNFWTNKPAMDGIGIQEHYAQVWAHLAKKYANEPAIIGYDLMNEPFPGSMAVHAQEMMFAKGAELITVLDNPDGVNPLPFEIDRSSPVESLATQWLTTTGRSAILQFLRDIEIYAQVVDVTEPLYAEFETTFLKVMYQRVAGAIRQVDPHTALFLETTMGSNMGVYSSIEPIVFEDTRDPFQVYAPHGYDLVVDTPDIAAASPERVELIFERHGETAKRLDMPMVVGEWGAYGRNTGTLQTAWHVVHQFEELLCSETYWAYECGMEKFPCFQAIHRPYPARVSGTLLSYGYDPQTNIFCITWQEDGRIKAPTRIYMPDWLGFSHADIHLKPDGPGCRVEGVRNTKNHYLVIPPTGVKTRRIIKIRGSEYNINSDTH
jgi:endoglycosylceramidase